MGQANVTVSFLDRSHVLPLVVAGLQGRRMLLLGRSWLDVLVLSWKFNIIQPPTPETGEKEPSAEDKTEAVEKSLSAEDKVMALAKETPSAFSSNIKELIKNFEANVVVKEDATLIL